MPCGQCRLRLQYSHSVTSSRALPARLESGTEGRTSFESVRSDINCYEYGTVTSYALKLLMIDGPASWIDSEVGQLD